jgi:hypothetical protein
MRAAFLALPVAIVVVVAAAPVFAQLGDGKPVYPRVAAPVVRLLTQEQTPADPSSFHTYREFYAYVAKKRGLADPEGALAVQQIESHASVERLRDYSGDTIAVVKLDAPRAGDNASFFVLREKESHLRLLGEMNARSYESSTSSGHLEFVLDAGLHAAQASRYQVDGDFLINLADLAGLDRNDPVELDVRNGF